ncbi:MAG: MlaA family lipoprotein [Planctomycetota bacterium]|jgi:phospholipid-binding lipoprotein MlaA
MKLQILLSLVLALLISGCASSEKREAANFSSEASGTNDLEAFDEDFDLLEDELEEQAIEIADPLEGFNRVIFVFNDVFYVYVGGTYKAIMPKPARTGIRNFFNSIATPVRFVNCLLQGKGNDAGKELDRFVINSTIGVLGFGDPARDKYGLELKDEDLGQTLAVYGVGDGFYVVLPLAGPSTLRDAGGKVGDLFLRPLFYLDSTGAKVAIYSVRQVNVSSFYIEDYEILKKSAVDPYIAIRESYIQYRKKQISE